MSCRISVAESEVSQIDEQLVIGHSKYLIMAIFLVYSLNIINKLMGLLFHL